MNKPTHFDYIIIGNGLAGIQLALKCSRDSFFSNKTFALIDPDSKSENDKTWSFWQKGRSQFDNIIHKSWSNANILSAKKSIHLELNPYTYNSIRAIDFYNYAISELRQKNQFQFIQERVVEVDECKIPLLVKTATNTYTASHVFDSRIPDAFLKKNDKSISIVQHFKGHVIKTEKDSFDDTTVVMMDYRIKDGDQTTFMYVLPFSKTEALVEFTYFTAHLVEETVYDDFIKNYIKTYLKIEDYSVIETEMGQIPMTTFDFGKFNTNKVTKIGTGGGWVKGSTGYSFKITEKKVDTIITNLKSKTTPSKGLFKAKYKFYDKVFLKVLKDENHKGEWVFQQFYGKNATDTMFRFLDEDSSFAEDLKIMWSLFSMAFIKAFFKTL